MNVMNPKSSLDRKIKKVLNVRRNCMKREKRF